MTTPRSAGIGLLAVLLVAAVVSSVAVGKKPGGDPPATDPPVRYQIKWLDGLGGNATRAIDVALVGVDKHRVVVGTSKNSDGNRHAFVYLIDGDATIDLDWLVREMLPSGEELPQGTLLTDARCINNAGLIAGRLDPAPGEVDFVRRVFACNMDGTSFQILPLDLYYQYAADVTETGVIIGWGRDASGTRYGFVWQPGSAPIVIDNLWDLTGVNNDLQIVGIVHPDKGKKKTFRWRLTHSPPPVVTAGNVELLTEPTMEYQLYDHTVGRIDVNNFSVIAGSVVEGGRPRPARYTDLLAWEFLSADSKLSGVSESINDAGQICGRLDGKTSNHRDRGFVFLGAVNDPVHGFWSLDDLVLPDDWEDPENPVWMLGDWQNDAVPLRISDVDESGYGTIVGYKRITRDLDLDGDGIPDGIGGPFGFVLTPVPVDQP